MARVRRDNITQLGLDFPGREVLSLPNDKQRGEGDEFNCATVYAAVQPTVAAIVRVNLWAELGGIRNLLASAFVPAGFSGPVIAAAGFACDGFHVTAQSTSPKAELDTALAAQGCCSTPGVLVPAELQQGAPAISEIIDPLLVAAITAQNPAPWQKGSGLWQIITDATPGAPPVALARGRRVVGIAAIASALLDGTILITLPTGVQPLITIPAGRALELSPSDSSLVGPATITWANLARIVIETVR